MKLLRTFLLITFACTVCIALFLAGNLAPTLRFTGDWPHYEGADVVLTAAPSEDWIAALEPNASVDVGEAGDTDAAEPTAADALETTTETPASTLDGLVKPETYTIRAEPDGSRVRIDVGDGTAIEADSIAIQNNPPVATPGGAATHDNSTYAAPADDNPIPEFLRGRELPRLAPGEKVVTVPVPVERWVDLSEADIVQVSFTQAPADVIKTGRIVSADGNFSLQVVARAEIYAMPQFAPAQRDTVPVCLKVSAKDAKELLALRNNPGRFELTVVEAASDRMPTPTRSPDPVSNRFGRPVDSREADAVNRLGGGGVNDPRARVPLAGGPLDEAAPTPSREPDAGEPTQPAMSRREPVLERSRDEDYIIPDGDPAPKPRASATETLANDPYQEESALPTIEPSEEGTVLALNGSPLNLALGATQIVECELRIQRVSGFDAKLIRVTPLTVRRLKIEALAAGHTSLRVETRVSEKSAAASSPFSVEVHVQSPLGVAAPSYGAMYGRNPIQPAPVSRASSDPKDSGISAPLENGREYSVLQQSTLILGTSQDIRTVDGFDKSLINVTTLGPRRLRIAGINAGETTIHVQLDGEDEPVLIATVRVRNQSHDELERLLKKLYPQANVTVESVRESVLLRGTVTSEDEIVGILGIAEQYAAKVLNQLTQKVPKEVAPATTADPFQEPSTFLPEGKRVFTVVAANPVNVRMLRPGETVDVYRVLDDGQYETIVANVSVFAVYFDHRHVSVLVTPEDVKTLTAAADESIYVIPNSDSIAAEPSGSASGESSLRDDIRALHDDVRRLIALLEKRAAVQPPAVEGLTPVAAARHSMFNEWGRAVLKKDYARALAVAETYVARDPDHHNYKAYAEKARQAITTGTINHPMLVVATAKWSGPCQKVQPLLTSRQNSGLPMVVLDADVEADAEFINQLEVSAFPTFVWTVDGRKLVEHVGVLNEEKFNRMVRDAVNSWTASNGGSSAGLLELEPPPAISAPGETPDKLNSPPTPPPVATEPATPAVPPETSASTRPSPPDPQQVAFAKWQAEQREMFKPVPEGLNVKIMPRDIAEFPARVSERIGISFTPVRPDHREGDKRVEWSGLRVDDVRADSPASRTEIAAGDIIIGCGGYRVHSAEDLQYALNESLAGGLRPIECVLQHYARRYTVRITIRE